MPILLEWPYGIFQNQIYYFFLQIMENKQFLRTDQNFCNSYYPGKPYSEFPVKVRADKKLSSADSKLRNPGLINLSRKIDLARYNGHSQKGQAESIRKYGMEYQKKLQKKFDSLRINEAKASQSAVNYERDIRYWYHDRIKVTQDCYLEYMKKLQKEFKDNCFGKQEKETLLNEMNKVWEEKVPIKLKKCFQS